MNIYVLNHCKEKILYVHADFYASFDSSWIHGIKKTRILIKSCLLRSKDKIKE